MNTIESKFFFKLNHNPINKIGNHLLEMEQMNFEIKKKYLKSNHNQSVEVTQDTQDRDILLHENKIF